MSRAPWGRLLLLGGIVVVCVAAIVYVNLSSRAFFHAVLVGNTGPVLLRDDWPQPLKELLADAEGAKFKISQVQVHCLCQGFDPEYVWRMESSADLIDHLKEKWELSPVDEPPGVIGTGRSWISGESAPSWWCPLQSKNSDFFVCKRCLEGEKSDRFQVALDKDGNVIFVHYWFNF